MAYVAGVGHCERALTGVSTRLVVATIRRARRRAGSQSIHSSIKETVMSVVLILNAVLAISVVVGIVSLLGWAIVADTAAVARRPGRHQRSVHKRKARFPATGPGAALEPNAE
jgi:hypothetical protein